jgi:hypothetical protein
VRIRHNPKHDHHSYSVEQNRARQALAGQIGSIRERAPSGAYRVAPPGPPERGAWFEADELVPIVTDADGLPVGGADAPPVQPAPWMRTAATEIADAINRTTIYGRLNTDQLQRLIAAALDRRNQP